MVNVVAMAAAPDERVPGVTTSAVPSNKEAASDPKGRKAVGSLARSLAILVAIVSACFLNDQGYWGRKW